VRTVNGPRALPRDLAAWACIGTALMAIALLLVTYRNRFDYAFELIDIPSVHVAVGLVLAGLVFLALPRLIARAADAGTRELQTLLAVVIGVGLALRLAMLAVNPVLEDDYHRYLWDGAVTAHGLDPYAVAPGDAGHEEGTPRGRLAAEAGVVMDRINHPDLRTIYPPVAQAAFALAHLIEPWSITAWRIVCLIGDAATLALLLALLRAAGRSPLWSALYWWNPVVVKELINSAHMEAILMPLVLGALLLAVHRRPLAASGVLGLAVGAKLWPIMLAPIVLRPLFDDRARLSASLVLLGGLCVLWAVLPLRSGIDETSGLLAYAQRWQTNSALFPALQWIAATIMAPFAPAEHLPGMLVRGATAGLVLALALRLSITPWRDAEDLMTRSGLIVAVVLLLSPAQFPWYLVWVLPFLAFRPSIAMLTLTATMPIYYASFYFHARDTYDVFRIWVVWLVWVPVWALLAREALAWRRSSQPAPGAVHA